MCKNKTYAYGVLTDTLKYMKEQHDIFLKKWKIDFDEGNIKEGRLIRIGKGHIQSLNKPREVIIRETNPIIVEECVKCKIKYPITPLYFTINSNSYKHMPNIDRISGEEVIQNFPKSGCINCTNKYRNSIKTEVDCLKAILNNYPKLNREWSDSILNICTISNIIIIPGEKHWGLSINRKNNMLPHTPDNCEKIASEFNIAQWNIISDLHIAWGELFKYSINEIEESTNITPLIDILHKRWNMTPFESGCTEKALNDDKSVNPKYSAQIIKFHLKSILQSKAKMHHRNDILSKRLPPSNDDKLTYEMLFRKLLEQGGRCYYTGIPLSLINDSWRHFSIERLDNRLNHTYANTVFICRIMNGVAQWNRPKLLQVLLSQTKIYLSENNKNKIQIAIQSNQTSAIEISQLNIQLPFENALSIMSVEIHSDVPTTELITEFKKQWIMTPEESGVKCLSELSQKEINRQYLIDKRKYHLRTKLLGLTQRKKITATDLYNKIIEQNARCCNSNIPFSLIFDSWNFPCIIRLDPSKEWNSSNFGISCEIFRKYTKNNLLKMLSKFKHGNTIYE